MSKPDICPVTGVRCRAFACLRQTGCRRVIAAQKALSDRDSGLWSRGGVSEEELLGAVFAAMTAGEVPLLEIGGCP